MSIRLYRIGLLLLAIAAASLAGLPAAAEEAIQSLEATESLEAKKHRMWQATESGDAETALRLGEELAESLPDNAWLPYDLARLRAQRGEPGAALVWLRKAAARGFHRLSLLDAEAGFEPLRERPEYQLIHGWISTNHQRAMELFRQRVARNPPLIVAPRGLDPAKPVPLIVTLHGRGGLAEPILEIWRPAAERIGAVLAAPQALAPYAEGFQWGTQEETDHQILQAIEVAAGRFAVDRGCVLLAGFSQGGRRSIATAFEHPERFAGIVVVGSAMDGEAAFPETPAAQLPPFFFMVGEHDRVLERTRATARSFAGHGIAHKLVVYPGIGHSYPRDHRRQLRRAIRFALPCAGSK